MYTVMARIADINVLFSTFNRYVPEICQQYLVSDGLPNIRITSSIQAIEKERNNNSQSKTLPDGFYETSFVYREFCNQIIDYNGFLLHGVAFDLYGCGVVISAKSGVGKTTHFNLWQELLKDKISIINGDKPIVRFVNDNPYVYGTPWNGKERMGQNRNSRLTHICFLERSKVNSCRRIEKSDVFNRLINQILMPNDTHRSFLMLGLIDKLINSCNFWLIKCNTDLSAAEVSYNKIFANRREHNATNN